MFTIQYKIDDSTYPIYDPRMADEPYRLKQYDGECHLAVNAAGSLSFALFPQHPYLAAIQRMRGHMELLEGSDVVFRGRIVSDSEGMYLTREVTCEGLLACLNDSYVPPFTFPDDFSGDADYQTAADSGNVVEYFLRWLLTGHNSQTGPEQQLKLGTVSVTDPNNYIARSSTKYQKTWEVVKSKLFGSALGGYLLVRYEADGNYVDYVDELPITNEQAVAFGENLIDIDTVNDGSEIFTAVLPVGKDGLTIESLPDGPIANSAILVKEGPIVYSRTAEAAQGGRITQIMSWDDVTLRENLRERAARMVETGAMSETISCRACDLHCVDGSTPRLRIGNVRVESSVHNKIGIYPLLELDIDLTDPGQTPIVLSKTVSTLTRSLAAEQAIPGPPGKDGAPGQDGATGPQGLSVLNVIPEFLASSSATELTAAEKTSDDWSTTLFDLPAGKYIWTRDRISYTLDGTTVSSVSYTEPYCLTSAMKQAASAELDQITVRIDGVDQEVSDLSASLEHQYVTVSDLGTYKEDIRTEISAQADSITNIYTYVSELQANIEGVADAFSTYRTETDGYIRTGIVDYDGTLPIFGIAIGQNLQTSVDNDGNTIIAKKNFRGIYTSQRLSFWQDEVEVAYVSNNQLYITNVVALSTMTVGEWSISGANAASGLVLKWIGGGS